MPFELHRPEISITSYGAVGGTVTGSCHVFESGHLGNGEYNKVVVDCGIFQGKGDLAHMKVKNGRGYEALSAVAEGDPPILDTHGHIDHMGLLPILYQRGCNSLIYTTEETRKLMEVNLTRSANIQKKRKYFGPLCFGPEDVAKTLAHVQVVKPFENIPISRDKKIEAVFCLNGHIPGSTSILIRDKSSGKNILFTGDIGRPNQQVTGGYNRFSSQYPQDPIDILITEATCFGDTPMPFKKREAHFQNEINNAFGRGNTVLMPCIQHRYMENLEIIRKSQRDGKIPSDIVFFRDGPALTDISDIYKHFDPDYFTTRYGDDPEFYNAESSGQRFHLDNLQTIRSHNDSKQFFNDSRFRGKKTIVFASGGMGDDGRAYDYFRRGFTSYPDKSVLFSCYQVEGTMGADLLEKQNNPDYRGARVVKLEGGSSHATGEGEIFGYFRRFNLIDLKTVVIVHGDDRARNLMESGIKQTDFGERVSVKLPDIGERVDLV